MSTLARPARFSMSRPVLSGVIRPPDPSLSRLCPQVTGDISSPKKPVLNKSQTKATRTRNAETSSIAGSRQPNRNKTCNVKSDFYLTNIPITKSSLISGPVSTGNDPDSYPFWREQWLEEYRRWSLPPRTDSADSPSSSSPSSSSNTMRRSWFSIKETRVPSTRSEKTSSPSCRYSLVDGTAKGAIKKNDMTIRKIRAYPNAKQKQMLARMAGTTRHLFNHASQMIRDRVLPFESSEAHLTKIAERSSKYTKKYDTDSYQETAHPWLNFIYMRNYLVNNKGGFVTARPWMKETANAIRQIAIREAISSHKAALSNLKAGNITNFKSPFRRKKDRSWSIGLDPSQIKNNRVLPASAFGHLKVAEPKFLKKGYDSQPRIMRDKNMRYYLILIDKAQKSKGEAQPSAISDRHVMAIDPGIRTRHTIFSTENGGEITEVGAGDIQRIVRSAKLIDRCISESHHANHQRRRRLLKQRLKLTARIADLKKEMDYQTISYLRKTASVVLLPTFKVHGMACRLHSKTARNLLCWGHGLFKQRLLDVSSRCDMQVMMVSEHYTSKTCGACGRLNNRLGGNKRFSCSSCGFEADRDQNAARNIFLRALRKA